MVSLQGSQRHVGICVAVMMVKAVVVVGKTRCACGKRVGFKWVVGKRARAPQCIYMLYVLLGMNRCQYDEWKGTLVCY